MVKKFRTKIVEIEAVRWTGDNFSELDEFTNGGFERNNDELNDFGEPNEFSGLVYDFLHETWINVKEGQWIVRGAKGEFYPCDDETFRWKYEEINRWNKDDYAYPAKDYI